jgi:hypothetical protein
VVQRLKGTEEVQSYKGTGEVHRYRGGNEVGQRYRVGTEVQG